jgi:S-adenosylmethionine:tRNA ribosyltransferase-isomerase
VPAPLAIWDVWTPIAGQPVAFEAPSAGFALDWNLLAAFEEQGIRFATITHAAGISSTGDAKLDALLPFDEPYLIPATTVLAINGARLQGGRVVAVGTTVVRALEHAALTDGAVRAGMGLATQRISRTTRLRVVDAILSGTHEPGTSHYELLRAFIRDGTLRRMDQELNSCGYRTHEFGDSVFVERLGGGLIPSRARKQAVTISLHPVLVAAPLSGHPYKLTSSAAGTHDCSGPVETPECTTTYTAAQSRVRQ